MEDMRSVRPALPPGYGVNPMTDAGPVALEVVLKGAVAACSKDSSTFSGESKFFVDKLAFVPMWLRFDS